MTRTTGASDPRRTQSKSMGAGGGAGASPVSLDLTFAFDAALGAGRGLSRDAFVAASAEAPRLVEAMEAERRAGQVPFLDLPARRDLLGPVRAFARARAARTTDVLLIGIGGSSRGAQVLAAARRPGRVRPRFHVLDTVDPHRARALLDTLPARTTTVVAVSKAGTTIETVAGLLVVERWLAAAVGARRASAQVALVCGEADNPLRARGLARGYALFPVPEGVGGRFSVLSPVGTLPAALLGIDPGRVLAGAARTAARCVLPEAERNPAVALALAHFLAVRAGRGTTVLLPYADALAPYGLWWEQLVAESVGKRRGTATYGVTPLPGVGPSDQHSLLQLLIDGPDDKVTVFVEVADRARDALRVPKERRAPSPAANGQRLGEILRAEREGTELALAEAGRPSWTIRVPDTGPGTMGALLYLYEVATMLWGRLAGIDPFDQPAVQRGKVVAEAALTGVPGEAAAALARHRAVTRTVVA